ncbi:MAG: hypothetical protein H7Z74_00220 [Anaerolineae bacterium]|nr:hypothetical protein [Gemmatimonadaceae bacterium]
MRLFRLCGSILLLAIAISCSSSTEFESTPLDGTWVSTQENSSSSGRYDRALTFKAGGTFISEFRSYGEYGESRHQQSSYQRTDGTYRVEGDRLIFHATRLIVWDRFHGGKPQIFDPYPYGTLFDDARYEVRGQDLTLYYTTYPADAPEPTTMTYARAR